MSTKPDSFEKSKYTLAAIVKKAVITILKRNGEEVRKHIVIYVGRQEYFILKALTYTTLPASTPVKNHAVCEFLGYKVIRVMEDSHLAVACINTQ